MTFASWRAWSWDYTTAFWTLWFAQFAVWEAYTGLRHENEMLTDHLRPIFLSSPVVWFVVLGLWLWVGVHLLAPALESALLEMVRKRP